MGKLQLDSNMSLTEMFEAMDEVSSNSNDGGDDPCDEIHLDCIDVDLPTAAAITQFILQHDKQKIWKSIEVEDCTGIAFDALLTVIFTCCVSKIKLSSVALGNLSESSLAAVALGIQSNRHLRKLILGIPLDQESTTWLSNGLNNVAGLRSFNLIDSTFSPGPAAQILAEGLTRATILQEFAIVAADICGERLGTILHSFSNSLFLKHLDLRGCWASNLAAVVRFLEQNTSIETLDLSYLTGNEDGLEVDMLLGALQGHPSLQNLHLCRNDIGDNGFETLLDAAQGAVSLRSFNLSLNAITSVQSLATRLVDNALPLRQIFLDGNPIHDPSPLLEALELSNTSLEVCHIPQHFEREQQLLHYYTRLNRGGRRLVLGGERIPHYVWPIILERANQLEFDNYPNCVGRAEVLYCLLHGPIFFPI